MLVGLSVQDPRLRMGLLAVRNGVSSKRLGALHAQLERRAKRNQVAEIPALRTAVPMSLMRVEVCVENLRSESAS